MSCQTEQAAQKIVCQWLDLRRLLYCHVPNGGKRSAIEAKIFRSLGVKPGVPDILIFDPPRRSGGYVGVALELKRERGGRVSDYQAQWHRDLADRGWLVRCYGGSHAAIDWLESIYGLPGT